MKEDSGRFHRLSDFLPTVFVILITAIFCAFTPALFTAPAFDVLLLEFSFLLINTAGLSFIMIGGGIDFSLGAQTALAIAIIGKLSSSGLPLSLTVVAAILACMLCGVINAIFNSTPHIVSAYTTVSTLIIFYSITFFIYGENTSLYIGSLFNGLHHRFLFIPLYLWISILCLIVMWVTLHFTYYGKYLKALGSNKHALQAVANPHIVRIISYTLASIFFSIQAILQVSRFETITPTASLGIELLTTCAALLSYSIRLPSRGSQYLHLSRVFSVTASAAIISLWHIGAYASGWSKPARGLLIGFLLAFSVLLDRRQHRSSLIYEIVRASGTNMD